MSVSGDAFVAAVMPAVDLVHNLARRLMRHPGDVEDLVQDTLARAWEAWARGIRPDTVGPWLSTICLNLARDRGRRAARSREVPWIDGVDPAGSADVEGEAITRVQLGLIEQALWAIPEPQRIAIVLMDICGLSAAETAAVTEAPRGTVLARVHRGRKSLAIQVAQPQRGRPAQHGPHPGGQPPPPRVAGADEAPTDTPRGQGSAGTTNGDDPREGGPRR